MSYDAKRAIRDGGRNTLRGRLVMAITMEDGDWRAKYGENRELAEIFGCSEQYVANVRMLLRKGWRPTGRPIPLQPEGLPARLLALDTAQPGLARKEQARILGTSPGMIRDTVWRLRRDGHTVSEGDNPGPGKTSNGGRRAARPRTRPESKSESGARLSENRPAAVAETAGAISRSAA